MPSARKGRGKGGGAQGLSNREKACPIARPSRDYQWNLDHREYGEDIKTSREETRRRQAQERAAAREHGEKVDLGAAGNYWEKVADMNKPKAKAPPMQSAGRNWTSGGGGYHQKSANSSGWSSWTGTAQSPPANTSSRGSTKTQYVKDTGAVWSHRVDEASQSDAWSSWKGNGGPGYGASTADTWAKPTADRYSESHTAVASECSYTADDARRLDISFPIAASPSHSSACPPPQAVPLEIALAGWQLDDKGIQDYFNQAQKQLAAKASRLYSKVVDLSGNQLSDDGLAFIVSWMNQNGIVMEEMHLQRNRMRSPSALIALCKDARTGIAAGALNHIAISGAELSEEVCWRLCEAAQQAKTKAPTASLRLTIHGPGGEKLVKVFRHAAEKFKVKIAGLRQFMEAHQHFEELAVPEAAPIDSTVKLAYISGCAPDSKAVGHTPEQPGRYQ